ncbi:glycosyltransferase [Thalassotalea fusca]
MHIVIATMQFGEGYHQGTEKYIKNLSDELINSGLKVTILAGDPLLFFPHINFNSPINSSTPQIIKIKTHGWQTVMGGETTEHCQLLKELSPDVLHFVNPGHIGINMMKSASELGIKTVLTITDFWWLCPKSTLMTLNKKLCSGNKAPTECIDCIANTSNSYSILRKLPLGSRILASALNIQLHAKSLYGDWKNRKLVIQKVFDKLDHIIFLSRTAKLAICDQYKVKNYSVIPVGLKQEWFRNLPAKSSRAKKVGFAGAIAPHKGLHILASAIQEIDYPVTLNIAGSVTSREYADLINQLNKRQQIQWHGQLSEDEMIAFIDDVDLMVVPSLSPENQPQVILEAHARKTPVLCSDVPGAMELVDDKFTYPAQNHLALKKKLIKVLDNLSENAIIPRPSSTLEMAKSTTEIYNDVTRGSLCS